MASDVRPIAEIIIVDGPDAGIRFRVETERIAIGRGRNDNLQLRDVAVTREHLLVEWNADADCHVMIQNGDSFTAFNGILASQNAGVRHQLADGDQIQIGGTTLRYFRASTTVRPDDRSE